MSPEITGIVGVVALLLLFLLRVPVAFAMALVGFVGFAYLTTSDAAFSLLARDVFQELTSYPLSAIPMFVLMGSFAFAAGISRRVYETANIWVGHFRGGLTMATVLGCAGFAAVCGSTTATAATMGRIALPEMKKYHYDDMLATGTVAAAGTLGVLIPPSTILLVYGFLTQESIGKLFVAGVMPGILLSLFFVLTVFLICVRNPALGPPAAPTSWKQKAESLTGVIEAIILFGLVIGGLFLGWFSPTKAGAIGAFGALVIGLARRELNWGALFEQAKDALRTSCMVLFIIMGATVFGHFMAISRIPFTLADWIVQLPISPLGIVGVIVFIFFIAGFFMDAMAMVVLLVPIFYEVLQNVNINLIWFGVLVVLVGEMGVITPPVGVNVFVIKGITPDIPIQTIFKGIFPFLVALIICTIILMFFPQIATFLPGLSG